MLPLAEARKNCEIVAVSDSQVTDWIDEITGRTGVEERVAAVRRELKRTQKEPSSLSNRRKIRSLYSELDELQFNCELVYVVMDRNEDYFRAVHGFTVNGVKYLRLVGTTGGIKESTIAFASVTVRDELLRRMDNGRDTGKKIIPAKLQAYLALVCSGSTPVSFPHGVAVVSDCFTKFKTDVVTIQDGENDYGENEPVLTYENGVEVELDESDGYGMMLPSLAERWSSELGLGYTASGMNTRFAFEKGMVFCFDYIDFAKNVAGNTVVKDVWGNEVDLEQTELVLTESMLKLWDSYGSFDEYIKNCTSNGYSFRVAKVSPKKSDEMRTLNYQFIQSYDMDDGDIDELIAPTADRVRDVLTGDADKALLFLRGLNMTDSSVVSAAPDFVKAMTVDRRVFDDPFVKRSIWQMIRKRVDDAKVGVLDVHGNFSIVSGDPYSLCQHMCGMEVTGLLKSGEIYSRFWKENGSDEVVCFRAPMTCHNNIRKMRVVNDRFSCDYWYRYMNNCVLFNSWDASAFAMNGMDKDGDLVFTTDNEVLLRKYKYTPCIVCQQRSAEKIVPTERDIIYSDMRGFGDDIGKITNRITSMYAIRSSFPEGSEERDRLDYRIMCGQHFQQNAIDKIKGIVSEPMPKKWYDYRTAHKFGDEVDQRIVAEKKPYFMRYIYPTLSRQYNKHIRSAERKCEMLFDMTYEELLALDEALMTDEMREFVRAYSAKMPVNTEKCLMNSICRKIEERFPSVSMLPLSDEDFDASILKSDSAEQYTKTAYYAVKSIYTDYTLEMKKLSDRKRMEANADKDAFKSDYDMMKRDFRKRCLSVCSNAEELCNIMIDLCYSGASSKNFVWDICGGQIIENLLNKNGRRMSYPALCGNGSDSYMGHRYAVRTVEVQPLDTSE